MLANARLKKNSLWMSSLSLGVFVLPDLRSDKLRNALDLTLFIHTYTYPIPYLRVLILTKTRHCGSFSPKLST